MTTATRTQRLEMIGSAAAGLAHDLNNQLTLIVNHLEVRDLDGARNATRQCSELVEALLAYSRGSAATACAIKPSAFLRAFFAAVRLPPGVQLVSSVMPDLPPVWADPVGLRRALFNLISNACQAMGNHGILKVTATPLAIEVQDSGPGIPPEVARRVFEPFFTTRGEAGTGLGLAIVRETMHECGGTVELDPDCAAGARFTLRFRKP